MQVNYFGKIFGNTLLNEFKDTIQDEYWHAEGNVLIHTEMVLNELINMTEYLALSNKDKKILFYAAFFHDYGKYDSIEIKNGRISFPNHSNIGHEKTINLLTSKKYKTNFILNVSNLVKYHCYPISFYNNENKILELSNYFKNLKMLYIISKADILGRKTNHEYIENSLMKLEEFKNISKKLKCY